MNRNNDTSSKSRGHISVTPQMLLAAIKRLQLRKVYVPSNLIGEYLQRSYPVDSNQKTFTEELRKKLNCAVCVGLILKYGEDAYYLPTLRQQANALKTAFTAFWDMYKSVRPNLITHSLNSLQYQYNSLENFQDPKFCASRTKNQNKNGCILKKKN